MVASPTFLRGLKCQVSEYIREIHTTRRLVFYIGVFVVWRKSLWKVYWRELCRCMGNGNSVLSSFCHGFRPVPCTKFLSYSSSLCFIAAFPPFSKLLFQVNHRMAELKQILNTRLAEVQHKLNSIETVIPNYNRIVHGK